MERFHALQEELRRMLQQSETEEDPVHAEKTLQWLLRLQPQAAEAEQIAAFAHDIDRAVPPHTIQRKEESYDAYKQRHAQRSAEIIADLMRAHGYEENDIKKTQEIVRKHETGGIPAADMVRDADSIAYFEYNLPLYLARNGEKRTAQKAKFMFSRASERAKAEILRLHLPAHLKQLIPES